MCLRDSFHWCALVALAFVSAGCNSLPVGLPPQTDPPLDAVQQGVVHALRPMLRGTLPTLPEQLEIGLALGTLIGDSDTAADAEERFLGAMAVLIKTDAELIAFDNADRAIAAAGAAEGIIGIAAAQAGLFQGPPARRKATGAKSEARADCQITFLFVNGVANTVFDLALSHVRLAEQVRLLFPNATFRSIYNRSAISRENGLWGGRICPSIFANAPVSAEICRRAGILIDVAEAAGQLLTPFLIDIPWGCEDIRTIESEIRSAAGSSRVIVVPHSQGNILVRHALERIEPELRASIGVIQTGSPEPREMKAARVVRIANCLDPVALLGLPAVCVTSSYDLPVPYHGFVRSYLEGAALRAVRAAMLDLAASLECGGRAHPLAGTWTTLTGEPGQGRRVHEYPSGYIEETAFTQSLELVRAPYSEVSDDRSNCEPTPYFVRMPLYSRVPDLRLRDGADPWSFGLSDTNHN